MADGSDETIVCFHAAEDKDETVTRCQMLLEKCGGKLVCILTRYHGLYGISLLNFPLVGQVSVQLFVNVIPSASIISGFNDST